VLRTEKKSLHLNEDCILKHTRLKFTSCGSTVKAKSEPPRLETDWKLKWNQLLCEFIETRREAAVTLNQVRKGYILCEWHRSYPCSWTEGLPSRQMRVCSVLGPDGGTATNHWCSSALPGLTALLKGGRQGRDLALLFHQHVPRRIPDDRYGPAATFVLHGGVTVSLLYFWPVINSQSDST